MNRIEEKFNELKNKGKKAFIPYICAGDSSLSQTENIIYTLESAGADIIELGIPFSDPLADGPVIQASSIRSLKGGFCIEEFFETVKKIRKNSSIPLAAMVYYSTIFGYGRDKFFNLCSDSGIDGGIIPDLPYEEYDEIEEFISKTDLCLIPFVAITSKDRIPMIVEKARGFIYCVSSLGVTGERTSFHERTNDFISHVKNISKVPVCVGFGISKRSDVEKFNSVADGCIVGSAIVRTIYENNYDLQKLTDFVKNMIVI